MLKTLNFFILALLIMASIENKLISSTSARQESNPDASLSANLAISPAISPNSDDLSGLTNEVTTFSNYLYECPPGGCRPSPINRF